MVLCSGCFDGLHAGHVRYLQAASRLCRDGESLVVAVAPDLYIRRYKQREPRWSCADRMETVLALGMVDRVVVHGDDGAAGVIRAERPRLFVKGSDWRDRYRLFPEILYACHAVDADIFTVDTPGVHTSEAFA